MSRGNIIFRPIKRVLIFFIPLFFSVKKGLINLSASDTRCRNTRTAGPDRTIPGGRQVEPWPFNINI